MTFSRFALIVFGVAAALPLGAFDLRKLDKSLFERLAAKADENVNVTLEGDALKLAGSFIAGNTDPRMQRLLAGLRSVAVRSFEFKKKGEYSTEDLAEIRKQINRDEWSRIVDVHSREASEDTEIYIRPGKEHANGILIIAGEATELTVVHIEGPIDLADLSALEGLGVPPVKTPRTITPAKGASTK